MFVVRRSYLEHALNQAGRLHCIKYVVCILKFNVLKQLLLGFLRVADFTVGPYRFWDNTLLNL